MFPCFCHPYRTMKLLGSFGERLLPHVALSMWKLKLESFRFPFLKHTKQLVAAFLVKTLDPTQPTLSQIGGVPPITSLREQMNIWNTETPLSSCFLRLTKKDKGPNSNENSVKGFLSESNSWVVPLPSDSGDCLLGRGENLIYRCTLQKTNMTIENHHFQ